MPGLQAPDAHALHTIPRLAPPQIPSRRALWPRPGMVGAQNDRPTYPAGSPTLQTLAQNPTEGIHTPSGGSYGPRAIRFITLMARAPAASNLR